MTDKTTLYATTEVMNALISSAFGSKTEALKASPADFFAENFGVASDGMDYHVVENDANTVHIALPCYETLDDFRSRSMTEEEIAEVAGGEFFWLAWAVATFGGGAAAAGVIGGALGGGAAGGNAIGNALGANWTQNDEEWLASEKESTRNSIADTRAEIARLRAML